MKFWIGHYVVFFSLSAIHLICLNLNGDLFWRIYDVNYMRSTFFDTLCVAPEFKHILFF